MNNDFTKVWLPVDHRQLGDGPQASPFFILGEKYAAAVQTAAGATPVLLPMAGAEDVDRYLPWMDGVMLTGSPANVHSRHYGRDVADPALPLDERRDSVTLALVRACVAQGVPLLGVCRGIQEINVALGGTLFQGVQNQPGYLDHREDKTRSFAEQYAPAHPVRLVEGTALRAWAGSETAMVNSLHGQAIEHLAPGLRPVAYAPDGLVEAVEIEGASTFALAVQWHPEWRPHETPFYAAIFAAFGKACDARRLARAHREALPEVIP